jgi:hypothetical protein
MNRQRRSQFEFRCYAGVELYERVLREAAARRISVSQCVRADLSQYYAIHDELTGCIQVDKSGSGDELSRRIMHTLLAEMETRMVASLDRQGSVFEESLNVIAWMIDEALVTILSAFPDDRPGVYRPPIDVFHRHEGWRAKVAKKLTSAEPRWPAPRQIGPRGPSGNASR